MRFLILLLLFGCASNLTEEEVEYRRVVDNGNWEICAELYKEYGYYTVHYDHTHGKHSRVTIEDIRRDLSANHCRYNMGDSWMNY